jgi:hypothetical protein
MDTLNTKELLKSDIGECGLLAQATLTNITFEQPDYQ